MELPDSESGTIGQASAGTSASQEQVCLVSRNGSYSNM